MKIQIASDLHTEFEENRAFLNLYPIKPVAPILILAGDIKILNHHSDDHYDFLKYVSDHWEQTYIVPGNHEFYHFGDLSTAFDLDLELYSNVKYLNHQRIELDHFEVFFSTLWSKAEPLVESMISDFKNCKYGSEDYTIAHHNHLHVEAVKWLNQELSKPKTKPRVVASHFVPCWAADAFPKGFNERGIAMKDYYTAKLDDQIQKWDVDFWIYGHNHYNRDSKLGNTQFVSNMLGYVFRDNPDSFRGDKVIEV
ncbi:metallophosphoesterase [Reichenbachiella ulvae]|uniref:Metallophosphoesterase n=1 Tax=Reichenbachiella ulvae TaxID=2980104 RepID=A0ABT3D027_9BACT|nr:metallophosphoesterase [Reichenbachiella ulvae]MCV9389153.1 metallophosphoesterase [Reichenbachiella ulvae]